MDAEGHGIVVGMVGFSMALMGFVLSLVAPVVQSVYPRMQPQVPPLVAAQHGHPHVRRRIVSPTNILNAERQTSVSPSGSADSVVTAKSSTPSSSTNATSVVSDANHLEGNGGNEGAALSSTEKSKDVKDAKSATSASPCTPRACIARVAKIRSKSRSNSRHAGSASTAESGLSTETADVAHQPFLSGRLTDSPASSILNLGPRSSSEIDVHNPSSPSSPTRPQFKESKEEPERLSRGRPRPLSRAKTFFHLGRSSSKHQRASPAGPPLPGPSSPNAIRAATFDVPHPLSSADMSGPSTSQQVPFPSGRLSYEITRGEQVDEYGVLDAEARSRTRHSKSKSVCLVKLKGKKKLDDSQSPATAVSLPRPSADLDSSQRRNSKETSPTRRSLCPRSSSERPTSLHFPLPTTGPLPIKGHSKKSASPPSRTNPYEAPYFFPMPTSPDAVDYVRLTRSQYGRAHSNERPPIANTDVNVESKENANKTEKQTAKDVSPEREPKTAPAHRVGFHIPLHFPHSHVRASSLSSPISPPHSPISEGQAEADELGLVHPPQDLRVRELKAGNVHFDEKGIVRSATLPENGLSKGPTRSVRPLLSAKGVSR